jgi:nucleotide-binding universal stress UspA family protein
MSPALATRRRNKRCYGKGKLMSIFPTRILLATDGSEGAHLAADTAATLAKGTGSELHAVCVGPGLPVYELPDHPARFEEMVPAQRQETQRVLDGEVERLEDAGAAVAEARLEPDARTDRAIVRVGEELGAGLIVVGSRGLGGLRGALMGSVSASVVRHAHCPVLVVREEPLVSPTRILLATDGSEDARLAADVALELAARLDAELHVTYVEPMPERHPAPARFRVDLPPGFVAGVEEEARAKLADQVGKMGEGGGEVAQAHARVGSPSVEIVTLAEELEAGLVVVGSRGLGGVRRALMGSVSDAVVRHAHCPVLVVRHENG